jgi:Mrp family chromosome partitioning ATPase
MAKLLETLRQRDGPSVPVLPLPSLAAAEKILPIHVEAQPEQIEEEYLFVEVGGPGKKLDGSPVVLAAAAAGLPGPRPLPPLPVEMKPEPIAAPVMRQPRPMSVAFQPWPPDGQLAKFVAPEVITYHQPDHPASKQYAELFEKVSDGLGKSSALLLSGAATKSGTTTVLLNLAFSGCGHRRIALVEGNLSRPALAERLGLQAAPGWHELLAGQIGLEKALQPTAEPQLLALPVGASSQGSCTLSPEVYRWVLGWLRQRFDLVLIDAPEVGDHAALEMLIPASDGIYLVLPQNTPENNQLGNMAQSVIRMGGRLRGLIHTQFESI